MGFGGFGADFKDESQNSFRKKRFIGRDSEIKFQHIGNFGYFENSRSFHAFESFGCFGCFESFRCFEYFESFGCFENRLIRFFN